MDIDAQLAEQVLEDALRRYPEMAKFGPRLEWRPLFEGGAFVVQYEQTPPRGTPDLWDFQNTVIKQYKQKAGIR